VSILPKTEIAEILNSARFAELKYRKADMNISTDIGCVKRRIINISTWFRHLGVLNNPTGNNNQCT
jgi:hypothetical protein